MCGILWYDTPLFGCMVYSPKVSTQRTWFCTMAKTTSRGILWYDTPLFSLYSVLPEGFGTAYLVLHDGQDH